MATAMQPKVQKTQNGGKINVTLWAYGEKYGFIRTGEGTSTPVHSDEEAIRMLTDIWMGLREVAESQAL